MRFRTAALTEVTPHDVDRWRRLADTAIEPSPNADPRFLHASLGFGLSAEDLELAIVESGDDFALVMPFTRSSRLSGAPVPHVTTSSEFMFVHASKNHPLVSPEDPAAAMRTLFEGLRAKGIPDLVNLTVFPADGALYAALEVLRRDGTVRVFERARDRRAYARRTDLDPTGEVWQTASAGVLDHPLPHLSKNTRRRIRRSVKGIEALADAPLSITGHDGDPQLIDEFLELQAAGWKGDASLGGPQFRHLGHEQWFRSVLDAFQADGRLRIWRLAAGDQTVFIMVTLLSGNGVFGFHDVYSERFHRHSPGSVGRLAILGATMSDPAVPGFDPSMEPFNHLQATSMFPSYREYAELLVAGGSLRSRATVAMFPVAKRIRSLARRERPSEDTAVRDSAAESSS